MLKKWLNTFYRVITINFFSQKCLNNFFIIYKDKLIEVSEINI